jgi:hypothetical protein
MTATAIDTMTAAQFDTLAEEGNIGELESHFDQGAGESPNLAIRRINLDLPEHMLNSLDAVAAYLAIPRQAAIKMLIIQSLRAGSLM